jgi:hypothetical protein
MTEKLVLLARSGEISAADISETINPVGAEDDFGFRGAVKPMAEMERLYATWALGQTGGHRGQTAEKLGIDPGPYSTRYSRVSQPGTPAADRDSSNVLRIFVAATASRFGATDIADSGPFAARHAEKHAQDIAVMTRSSRMTGRMLRSVSARASPACATRAPRAMCPGPPIAGVAALIPWSRRTLP